MQRREFLRIGFLSAVGLVAGCSQPKPSPIPSGTPKTSASPSAQAEGAEFIVRNRRPNDLETPVEAFQTYLTPNDRFFVRSHHPEPTVSEADWKLYIEVPDSPGLELDLKTLKTYETATVVAVLQCAGNSRGLYSPKVPGVQWGRGAVGNAEWKGARLVDVLKKAGVKDSSPPYVIVRGSDKPLMDTVPNFVRQLPLTKCLHPDTLLAYQMNGEPLPRLHGGPVRLVVPGWVGDDWIKWVSSIKLQAQPTEEFFFKRGYRYPDIPCERGGSVPPEHMQPMEQLVTRSLFSTPSQSDSLPTGKEVAIKGVAWTGGDQLITRVEVSDDDGKSWNEAVLEGQPKPYAWRLWSFSWTPTGKGPVTLRSRATDNTGFVQPLEDSPWNPGGYLWRSADRLEVEIIA